MRDLAVTSGSGRREVTGAKPIFAFRECGNASARMAFLQSIRAALPGSIHESRPQARITVGNKIMVLLPSVVGNRT